uniref:MULE transposase domain-containing protein n=1 Tax=Lactuca sativa TaxID=4236 RepID=A0A9R1WZG0_LACSA|nr:hypothetical protein LSAT_V11C700370180 [Lactuca sativa]
MMDTNDEVETNNGYEKPVFHVHNRNQKWDKMVSVLGMRFSNPLELENCVTNYAVKNSYNLCFEKNDSQRLLIRCCKDNKNPSCPFTLVGKGRNSRKYVLDEKGSLIEHYGGLKLPWVIWINGCFLKGICKVQLLAAAGRDENNHIYPIVKAMVVVENKETWKWFLDLLLDEIGMGVGHGLTIISDQHKVLLYAIKLRVLVIECRQCVRHIYANFKKRFKGEQFRKMFWDVVGCTTQPKFEAEFYEIKKIEPLAYEHLKKRDPKSWCKAFFQVDSTYDAYENGISKVSVLPLMLLGRDQSSPCWKKFIFMQWKGCIIRA